MKSYCNFLSEQLKISIKVHSYCPLQTVLRLKLRIKWGWWKGWFAKFSRYFTSSNLPNLTTFYTKERVLFPPKIFMGICQKTCQKNFLQKQKNFFMGLRLRSCFRGEKIMMNVPIYSINDSFPQKLMEQILYKK